MKKKLFINDLLLILAIMAVSAAFAIKMYLPEASEASYIEVVLNNSVYGTFSLSQNTSAEIDNTGVILRINNETAYIENSDCPDRHCLNSPAINASSPDGASIVCLPNRVAIIKKNGSLTESQGVDTVAG